MADGIIQYIRLALNRASLKEVKDEAAAAAKDTGQAVAEGVAEGSKGAASRIAQMAKSATDAVAIELQKNATGYSKWQQVVRAALSNVGKGYDQLKAKVKLVDVPDEQILDGIERARLRRKFKGRNDEFHQELKKRMALEQLSGTELTKLGQAAQFFGINVAKAAQPVQTLIGRLQQLGASGTEINRKMPFWANGMNRFGNSVMALGKAFGFYYSARQAVAFLQDSVKVAAASQVAWAQLSTTVSDYGGTLSKMMPQIRPVIEEQARLGVSYTDSAKNLARLIQITGDLHGSLRALPIVQDMAASGFMTLEQASKQVGRAMLGDLGSIGRYGIFLEKNKDVLDQLSKRFGGEQLMRAQTLTGTLERMGVAWYEVKVQLGGALAAGAQQVGLTDHIISGLKDLREWVIRNQVALKLLGVTITTVFTAFSDVVFMLINGFTTIINMIATVSIGLTTLGKSLPSMFELGLGNLELMFAKFFRFLADGFDRVFQTDLASSFDGAITRLEHQMAIRRRKINQNMAEGHELIQGIWFGEEPDRAPDMRSNPAVLKIRAREHQRRRSELGDVRGNVLSGDEDLRERGLKRLSEMEQEINERMEEEKDNEKELIALGKERATVLKIRADLEKQQNKESRAELLFRRLIARLSAVAREQDDQKALVAVRQLQEMREKMLKAQRGIEVGSTLWLKNEEKIKAIEDGIQGHLDVQDRLFTDRVRKLAQMVDLDVNRAEAVSEINGAMAIEQERFEQAREDMKNAEAGSNAYNDALERQIVAKSRLVTLEGALQAEFEKRGQQIDRAEKELQVAETRVKAERDLQTLLRQAQKQATTGKTQTLRDQGQTDADRIKGILAGGVPNLRDIEKQIRSAEQLAKHAKTRAQGVKELTALQEKLNELSERENLTATEKVDIQARQIQLAEALHKASEPNMNILEELAWIYEHDLPEMAQHAAEGMADAFHVAFVGIMRDTRTLNHALNSIPKGMAKAMLAEIAQMAKGKSAENIAWAVEALGHAFRSLGNPLTAGLAPFFFKSAAEHTAAAAAWGLLGGAAGGLGQSASDAYSNATDFASGSRGGTADDMSRGGPDIYLTIDGVDPSNPRHQRLVGETSREYEERYGGRIILTTGR